jgi:glucokinase
MKSGFCIGIDLGGTNLKIAILDRKHRIVTKEVLSTKRFRKKDNLIQAICYCVNDILKKNSLNKQSVVGIGLGLPGPIDHKKGLVHFFPNIPGWREVSLKKILQKRLGLSVFLDNDAKLMALAEYRFGNAAKFKNVLCLTLGTGVGGGLIINGSLYRGQDNAAGEIGHVPLNESGTRCNCGGSACLETYIGNNRILALAKKAFKRNISLEELSSLAKKKDRRAINLWLELGERLGVALAGIVNLLNLDAVVIGGGVANAGNILFDKVKQTLRNRAMNVQAKRIKVFKAKLANDAGLIGASLMVKENIGS